MNMDNFPIKHGVLPTKRDGNDYSFHKTFGAIAPYDFPDTYDCDAGLTMPDQNADGFSEGCTGYTQSELCGDEDGVVYKPSYTYEKTLLMANLAPGSPCDMRDSLKSTIVYGIQRTDESSDLQAFPHRRGQYFNVQSTNDAFDGIRSALWQNRIYKRSVSIGTPWFSQWHAPIDGIVPMVSYSGNPNDYPWHNWKISGWKTINGIPYLIGKTWQGKRYGDNGLAYFSRDIVNKIMDIPGVAAFTLAQADPNNIQTVKLFTLQTLLSFFQRLLKLQVT